MVHKLPDASKIQGIVLYKSGQTQKDWYFELQYTDEANEWHEFRLSMLDGLYLLNLLKAADEEQHLNFSTKMARGAGPGDDSENPRPD